jgi:geranylgeranyl diphosphate synthase type I
MNALEKLINILLPEIESELLSAVSYVNSPGCEELFSMIAYHMGWEGEGAGEKARGKRVRPILTLITTEAAGGDWKYALPAAVAIELIHNFSLIHDDIEDNSPFRRGRPTVWKIWGIPHAINAGDALFTLGHLSILKLAEYRSDEIILKAVSTLQNTCLQLTQGQYLDIAYVQQDNLTEQSYWSMVDGKTAALLSTCTKLGALIADSDQATITAYQDFGYHIGLAFQAQDDLLGIWGDINLTGKSNDSDLLTGKKSLPILYGLSQNGTFADRWIEGAITPEETVQLAKQLENEGAKVYTQEAVKSLTEKALLSLTRANPKGQPGEALFAFANQLINRQV